MSRPLIDPLERPDDFLRWLSSEDSVVIYASTLEIQTQLNESQIRAVLRRLDAWRAAREVLDVGCGPGNLPHKFKDLIAGKRYIGIDRERHFIAQARKRVPHRKNVEFICKDLFDFHGRQFDVVYLWAVLQHLPSVKDALQHLRTLLKPRGSIILLDSSGDDDVRLKPLVRSVRSMYDELRRLNRNRGRNDTCLDDVKLLASSFGFEAVFEKPVHIPISSAKTKRQFVRYIVLVSELLERFYSIRSNRRRILTDLMASAHAGREFEYYPSLNREGPDRFETFKCSLGNLDHLEGRFVYCKTWLPGLDKLRNWLQDIPEVLRGIAGLNAMQSLLGSAQDSEALLSRGDNGFPAIPPDSALDNK